MKILILGGTGAMGVPLVKILAESGHDVFVTSRKRREGEGGVRYIEGNAHDMAFLKSVLKERYDAIIDFMSYSSAEFAKRYELLLASTWQYVFISSARVYAEVAGGGGKYMSIVPACLTCAATRNTSRQTSTLWLRRGVRIC